MNAGSSRTCVTRLESTPSLCMDNEIFAITTPRFPASAPASSYRRISCQEQPSCGVAIVSLLISLPGCSCASQFLATSILRLSAIISEPRLREFLFWAACTGTNSISYRTELLAKIHSLFKAVRACKVFKNNCLRMLAPGLHSIGIVSTGKKWKRKTDHKYRQISPQKPVAGRRTLPIETRLARYGSSTLSPSGHPCTVT
jgi:hypothetical protein